MASARFGSVYLAPVVPPAPRLVEGSSWKQSSVFYGALDLVAGDHFEAELLSGGPFRTFSDDGSFILDDPATFRVRAGNATGWGAWATFEIIDG